MVSLIKGVIYAHYMSNECNRAIFALINAQEDINYINETIKENKELENKNNSIYKLYQRFDNGSSKKI
jgi:hypothetical protein